MRWQKVGTQRVAAVYIFAIVLIPLNCKLANSSPEKTSLMRYLIIIFIENLPFKTLLYYNMYNFTTVCNKANYSALIFIINKYFSNENIRQLSNANVYQEN